MKKIMVDLNTLEIGIEDGKVCIGVKYDNRLWIEKRDITEEIKNAKRNK